MWLAATEQPSPNWTCVILGFIAICAAVLYFGGKDD